MFVAALLSQVVELGASGCYVNSSTLEAAQPLFTVVPEWSRILHLDRVQWRIPLGPRMSLRPRLKALMRLISCFVDFSVFGFAQEGRIYLFWGTFALAIAANRGKFGNASINVFPHTIYHAFLCCWFGKQYYVASTTTVCLFSNKNKYYRHEGYLG